MRRLTIIPPSAKHGFDLTSFDSAESWLKVSTALKLKFDGFSKEHNRFEWRNDDGLFLCTGNDPVSGLYAFPNMRGTLEPGYASYMGLEGPAEAVNKAVELIHQHAAYIKDESPGARDFI